MAISHVQPVLLLLASLFFLPVLCALKFEYCNNNTGYAFANISGVSIDLKGDDTKIFIFGNANRILRKGSVGLSLRFGEGGPVDGAVYELSEVVNALPITPDNVFILTLTEVPLDDHVAAYDTAIVSLYDDDDESSQTLGGIEILCIKFNPHSSTTSSAALSE